MADDVLLPLLKDTHVAKVTGSGDPFGSHHFRYLLKHIDRQSFPDLRLEIQTNGQLLDRRAWKELELDCQVDSIWISIDAGRAKTYDVLRAGGSFERLLKNLAFVGALRAERKIKLFRLDTVVQQANYKELLKIVEIGRSVGADIISFQRIRNWGTFTTEAFRDNDVASPSHPEFSDFLAILASPALGEPYIELGNLVALRDLSIATRYSTSTPPPASITRHGQGRVNTMLDRAYEAARSNDAQTALRLLRSALATIDLGKPKRGHFLLMHMGRCGSTVLADLLGQRPDLSWDTELFTADRGLWQEGDNPFDVLLRRMSSRAKPYFGFELKTWQPHELGIPLALLLDCLDVFGIDKFVLLHRSNIIRRIISSDLGHRTGEWHAHSQRKKRTPKIRVKLEEPQFTSRIRAQEHLWNAAMLAFQHRHSIQLTYEADIGLDPIVAYRKVCEFHSLRPFDDVKVSYSKTTPFELGRMIENFDELANYLQGSGYEWMLEEK